MKAVITGDIISSASLQTRLKRELYENFNKFINELINSDSKLEGEVGRGDWFQLLLHQPEQSLFYALKIKCYLRSFSLMAKERISADKKKNNPIINQRPIDARIAIGIGNISFINKKIGISDGEAFQWSGKLLDEMKYHRRKLMIHLGDTNLQYGLDTIFILLDSLLSKTSPAQCNVIDYKLAGITEIEISKRLKVAQSAINQHSSAAGWKAIDSALRYFKNVINTYANT